MQKGRQNLWDSNIFKKSNPGLFFVYFQSFSNKHQYNFYNKSMCKNVQMSIQYIAPGFEPTTFKT